MELLKITFFVFPKTLAEYYTHTKWESKSHCSRSPSSNFEFEYIYFQSRKLVKMIGNPKISHCELSRLDIVRHQLNFWVWHRDFLFATSVLHYKTGLFAAPNIKRFSLIIIITIIIGIYYNTISVKIFSKNLQWQFFRKFH